MEYQNLDGIDKPWSRITLGCWQIAPSGGWGDQCSPEEADAVVKTALDEGITAFDTAEGYGDGESERRLGRALGAKKEEVIIVSKIWPDAELNGKAYEKRLNDSLRALGRDYVDVYLVHWPGEFFNTPEKSETMITLMEGLQASGKVGRIGLSNFKAPDLALLGDALEHFSINEIPYSLLQRHYEGEATQRCREMGVGYMAYAPSAKGLLARPLSPACLSQTARSQHPLFQEPVYSRACAVFDEVRKVANELERNPIEVAINWVLEQSNVLTAIVGSRQPAQVREFSGAGRFQMNPGQLKRLQEASDRFQNANQTEGC
ncbi:MAG: aldo/keto reductase [Verrucomicrobiota bacterium]